MARRLAVSQKVRKMVHIFGGKRATVRVMKAASSSSLRRWMNRKCRPLKAHVFLVNDTYEMAQRMGKELERKNWRAIEERAALSGVRMAVASKSVLLALRSKSLTFSQLRKKVKFSPAMLNSILKILRKEHLIIPRTRLIGGEKILVEYRLRKSGKMLSKLRG